MLNASQIQQVQATVPILRAHGNALTSYFYQRMLKQHPELKEVFNLGHQRSGHQAKALAGAVLAYAENIQDPSTLQNALMLIAQKHVSLNIQAEQYAIVGENLLASISEVLNVPMQSELIEAWALAYQQLANLLSQQEQHLYDQHLQQAGGWLGWRAFTIVKKSIESSEITSFYLKPLDGKELPSYQAGQYISLRLLVPELGIKQPRQYSLSEQAQPDHYRISVKREPGNHEQTAGWVSNTLHQHCQVGDTVELSMPMGSFYLKTLERPTVLISAGVGITPILAMLKQLAAQRMPQPVYFLHACRNAQVHAFQSEVQQLAQQYPQLQCWIAYEQPTEHDRIGETYHHAGRLETSHLAQITTVAANADYYICGPVGFIRAQYQTLATLGIAPTQLFAEVFNTGGFSLTE